MRASQAAHGRSHGIRSDHRARRSERKTLRRSNATTLRTSYDPPGRAQVPARVPVPPRFHRRERGRSRQALTSPPRGCQSGSGPPQLFNDVIDEWRRAVKINPRLRRARSGQTAQLAGRNSNFSLCAANRRLCSHAGVATWGSVFSCPRKHST
jgi:hypothetical protein